MMDRRPPRGERRPKPASNSAKKTDSTREGRGPETSHYLEEDTFDLRKTPAGKEFDEDLER